MILTALRRRVDFAGHAVFGFRFAMEDALIMGCRQVGYADHAFSNQRRVRAGFLRLDTDLQLVARRIVTLVQMTGHGRG